ncbi:hemagglutinin [Archangium minus]|uniref:Hemagglutinin n=1 Tax=Archangium minus TaxID=83450 RepID=A0ABY9WW27_9BACT|nr:hemagglutinin [Archangium minus]
MRIALFLIGLLVAGRSWAEPDTFELGSGKDGDLLVSDAGVVINRYARLMADAAEGSSTLTVSDSTGFAAGDLVLLHQSTGLSPAPDSGDQNPINLGDGPVGRFEYARVASVSAGVLGLTAPLLYGYAANLSQVVEVPEYTALEVQSGASLRAEPWDGGVGGILAVMVTGSLRNDGLITVDGAGFRGGAFLSHDSFFKCTGLDEPVDAGGAYKGEGLVAGSVGSASGRGNLTHGGGGGICHNSGGGGGGHAGRGGPGGRTAPEDDERDVGGLGGAPLVYLPYERLVFGGGGGAGEGNNNEGTGGGTGGGLMLIRAGDVQGQEGRFSAMGTTTPEKVGDDGAGGGGAGGAISIRTAQRLECGSLEASGGAGGSVGELNFPVGPGGGGGGGVVFLQGSPIACTPQARAGAAGRTAVDGGTHGAGPEDVDGGTVRGSEQIDSSPFRLPAAPTLTYPADGATQVAPELRIEGHARPGVQRVQLFLDGKLLTQLEPEDNGHFAYDVPKALTQGVHELRASAEQLGVRSPVSAPNTFEVDSVNRVLPPMALDVGCGCASASGVGLWAGMMLLAVWASRRRRSL